MKFIVVKKRKALYIALAIILCVIFIITLLFAGGAMGAIASQKNRKLPIYNVNTAEKKVAVSFDAAWGADKTQNIMDILKRYNANATFFLVEFWVKKYPEMTKSIADNGFEVGTHSATHPKMSGLSREKMAEELNTSCNAIENITGKRPNVFRPPFGDYNDALIEVATQNKLYTIQWDVDSLDWKDLTASAMTKRVMSRVKNGSIVLFHNNSKYICEALPMILDLLTQKGYQIVSVWDLIYKDNYHIKENGEQFKNN